MRVRITRPGRRSQATWACGVALLATFAGCERGNGELPTPAFVPSWAEARQALESALSAWRDAPAPLPATFEIRGVQFAEKRRKPDQRLLSFQILGQTEIENARQFTVRLTLEGEESPELVKYNVLGRDPVWVFRLDDYEKLSHWQHEMELPAPEPGEKPKPATEPAKTN
jgi:hypothetical protein